MNQLITLSGFVDETWPANGVIVPVDGLLAGDLPPVRPLAIDIEATTNPGDLAPWCIVIDLIRIPFANSADGRGVSLALRFRSLGYAGRIRAVGHVLVDQFRAALRVGIDEIEIDDLQAARNPEAQWLAARDGASYQARLFAAE